MRHRCYGAGVAFAGSMAEFNVQDHQVKYLGMAGRQLIPDALRCPTYVLAWPETPTTGEIQRVFMSGRAVSEHHV